MTLVLEDTDTAATATLSLGTMLLIVLPSTIALLGVLTSTVVSSVTTHRAEDRRARNTVYNQVLEEGRRAELEALYATAEFIAKLKVFNRAMSGNSGVGEDDEASAKAFEDFTQAFDGFDSLTRVAVTVEALGSKTVSDRVSNIRSETLAYVLSLGPTVFEAKRARAFEERIDALMRDLVDEVRRDFGTEEARAGYRGK